MTTSNDKILKAVDKIKKYGVKGLDDKYMIITDIDGDERIAPVGLMDKYLCERGYVNIDGFVKIKDLLND